MACTELAEVLPLVNTFKNKDTDFGFSLKDIPPAFEKLNHKLVNRVLA
ncbi:MAG: hypothetical protein WCO06_06385 [Candidatus Roizmanbacteria bacterium]